MADVFDQIDSAAHGDVFDQIHQESSQPAQVRNPEGFFGGLTRNYTGMAHLGSPTSWLQAAGSALQSHIEQYYQAKDAAEKGRYAEAIGHGLAAIVPFIGPAAAHAGEAMGGTEAQFDKFGNVIKPGVAPSTSAGAGEAAGLLLPAAVSAAAPKVAGAAGDVASAAEGPLRESAATEYGRVLNATTKGNKLRSARVAPELANRGVVAGTMKGLQQKLAQNVQGAGQALADAYDQLPADASVPLKDVIANLDERANKEFTVPGSAPDQPVSPSPLHDSGLALAKDIKDRLTVASDLDPATGERTIPVQRVRQLRQMYDEIAQMAGRYDGKTLADHAQASVQGMAADSIRNVLAQEFPNIADLNKEYAFWKDAHRVVSDTLTRRQGQAVPLGVKMAKAAGTGAGFVQGGIPGAVMGREAMGMLERAMSSPAWRTVSATTKMRLANAIANGDRAGVEFGVRSLARATGVAEAEGQNTTNPNEAVPAQ